MSYCLYSENGLTIQPANSFKGKWKIRTSPGMAIFFKTVTDAKKWARKQTVRISISEKTSALVPPAVDQEGKSCQK